MTLPLEEEFLRVTISKDLACSLKPTYTTPTQFIFPISAQMNLSTNILHPSTILNHELPIFMSHREIFKILPSVSEVRDMGKGNTRYSFGGGEAVWNVEEGLRIEIWEGYENTMTEIKNSLRAMINTNGPDA